MQLGGKSVALLLLVVILVALNFLASHIPARLDLTEGRIYTLSPGSKALLAKIEEPVTLHYYFSRGLDGLPIRFKNYATRIEEMLRQYERASGGRVVLRLVDPQPDTDEETQARRSGITPQPVADGRMLYLGLVASQADQEVAIPIFQPNREPYLEYDISQAIHSVQQFDKPRLGLLSGLPLRSAAPPFAMPGQPPPPPDQLVIDQWGATFEVVDIQASDESLPDNLDVLAVIHPQDVGEKLLFAIDQFLLSGKPVFVAVDPSSYHFKSRQQQNPMMMGRPPEGVTSDLPRLLGAWGVTFNSGDVVGDLNLATAVQTSAGVSNFPLWISLRGEQFAADALPTASLNSMLMIEAGALEVAADRGYEVTPLIQTTSRSSTVASMLLNFTPPAEIARQIRDGGVRKDVAVLVRGSFRTAFADGAPKDPEPETPAPADGDTPPPPPPAPVVSEVVALRESTGPGTLVVVADTDWILDDFSVRRLNFLGTQAIEPLNDNLTFASNLVDFLGGSRDLISIRGKGQAQRPFTVIRELELAAEERYQSELQALEARRTEVQQEITKLQTGQTAGRTLIATPEVQEALERYRVQEAELRTSIRKIRLSLRTGIEALQNRLTVFNLVTIPLAIVVVGSWVMLRRNRRQKSSASS